MNLNRVTQCITLLIFYQVVIGDQVPNVYAEVSKLIGKETAEDTDETVEEGGLFSKFVALMSGIFMPVMGVLAAAGILKGFLVALTVLGWISEEMGVYKILFAASDAFFYFMPILLGFSAGKTFKTNHWELDHRLQLGTDRRLLQLSLLQAILLSLLFSQETDL